MLSLANYEHEIYFYILFVRFGFFFGGGGRGQNLVFLRQGPAVTELAK